LGSRRLSFLSGGERSSSHLIGSRFLHVFNMFVLLLDHLVLVVQRWDVVVVVEQHICNRDNFHSN